MTPNASKILRRWGLGHDMDRLGAEPTWLAVHRYSDGKDLVRDRDFSKKMHSRYDAPFVDMHRADLQLLLRDKAVSVGVNIRLDARVESVDHENATVLLHNGEKLTADLIVGADGLWSQCRESLLGKKDPPLPTGDLAYRIVLTLDQIKDPELKDMVANPSCQFWVGPNSHVVAYSLRHGTMYNIVLLCPDDLPENVSRQPGSVEEMRTLFKDWDPLLRRFLDCVDTVDKWRLMHRAEMQSWTNEKGNLVLIGDSCHPMLPYLAQGANSSIEDGAVLGRVLSHLSKKKELRDAISIFEKTRKTRSEAIVRETFSQRQDFHMVDGETQQKRDELFSKYLGRDFEEASPSRWSVFLL
jgi:salicylate hydroxylase